MRITVKAFGAVAWALGVRTLAVDLPPPAVVGDLLSLLTQQSEGLARFLPAAPGDLVDAVMILVQSQEVSITHSLSEGDEVYLVVPASGGAPAPEEGKRDARRLHGTTALCRPHQRKIVDRTP